MYKAHLLLTGRVQGVGFRPLVYKLAQEAGLNGVTHNSSEGLHVLWHCNNESEAESFKSLLLSHAPEQAKVRSARWLDPFDETFVGFHVISHPASPIPSGTGVEISPDFAWCEACFNDFRNAENRRFGYPFITCATCGPRYSILEKTVWERSHTVMTQFPMCADCEHEYNDPENRRFLAESISCPTCGITLSLHAKNKVWHSIDDLHEQIRQIFENGQILAVKGIGGFLLLSPALDLKATTLLRERKHRPHKPLAVLMSGPEMAKEYVILSDEAKDWLISAASPIVLCPLKKEVLEDSHWQGITGGLDHLGIMFPYAPVLQWICDLYPYPLVATSANYSGDSLISEFTPDQKLFEWADFVLDHDRPIINAQDDSVLVLETNGQAVMLRRARGFAPTLPMLPEPLLSNQLGMGAMLKSSFCIRHNGRYFLSPYLGDTAGYEAHARYEHYLQSTLQLIDHRPESIITDMHPDYPASQMGRIMAQENKIPLFQVQHHTAHIAALMAEHTLDQSSEPVLFVAWDGTGLGTDGGIWGSEFFLWHQGKLDHVAAFKPLKHISSDKFAKEPALAASSAALCYGLPSMMQYVPYGKDEIEIYSRLIRQSTLLNRSCGRYFDAVASALNLVQLQSFEGQAAMHLQMIANKGSYVKPEPISYTGNLEIDLYPILEKINWISKTHGVSTAALHWHLWLASVVTSVANFHEVKAIGLTGGVFQNTLLNRCIRAEAEKFFPIFTHQTMPANDENISFGQIKAMDFFKNSKYVLGNTR